ncbi:type I-MYXAN CRISPR-associated protein Cas5/Cmx5/DevS [Alicyclobacillus cellulosilyticus]|uniref:Type I-MYXAN CRISPR-associated protein Cas5/Cmx5/DevS n=1 Tax=Alicyclobacillus cellulosilyticus TaxID=1003997 RepID=A0A917KEK8_9BACL|nr:CRISPR-associated protein Cas5 [Alicyclobacillus cellulosilyticus]GGJ07657.1 type I-MYXAN CRISPR-associated protein Cas5/Cmx5/DevS [Alicyclobacillus cellulosilyticus]
MSRIVSPVEDLRWIRVSVPIASFTVPFAREFAESYPFPPPATVYGMLLSYIGETNRWKYEGTRLAIVVIRSGSPSLVIRKTRRVKVADLNSPQNSKPDYQTLLTGLEFMVGLCPESGAVPNLWRVVESCYHQPERSLRVGGLSCGESHHLIDEFSLMSAAEVEAAIRAGESWLLEPAEDGEWSVPVWVDHVGSEKTVWERAAWIPARGQRQVGMFEIAHTK